MNPDTSKPMISLFAVRASLTRLLGAEEEDDALVAFVEALWWLCTADKYLWEWPGYVDARDADGSDGQVLPTLRSIRNSATHDPLTPWFHEPGDVYSIAYSHNYWAWCWKPYDDLPPETSRIDQSDYQRHLAGRPLWDSVMEAVWFVQARIILHKPQIPLVWPKPGS